VLEYLQKLKIWTAHTYIHIEYDTDHKKKASGYAPVARTPPDLPNNSPQIRCCGNTDSPRGCIQYTIHHMAVNYLCIVGKDVAHDGVSQLQRFCEEATGFLVFGWSCQLRNVIGLMSVFADDDPLQIRFVRVFVKVETYTCMLSSRGRYYHYCGLIELYITRRTRNKENTRLAVSHT
jgi:hypothetical protein